MTSLCFGGSFNPIHHGHLICARAAAEKAGFERVVLIPNSQSPHKLASSDWAGGEERLQMCRLATGGSELFEVEDLELRRSGPSYTIDTARELKRRGWETVHWLIGTDTLPLLPSWHEPDALLEEVQFVIVQRPGSPIDWAALPPKLQKLRNKLIDAPLMDISASDIRRRVAEGKSIDYLTPQPVIDYIRAKGLYRSR